MCLCVCVCLCPGEQGIPPAEPYTPLGYVHPCDDEPVGRVLVISRIIHWELKMYHPSGLHTGPRGAPVWTVPVLNVKGYSCFLVCERACDAGARSTAPHQKRGHVQYVRHANIAAGSVSSQYLSRA